MPHYYVKLAIVYGETTRHTGALISANNHEEAEEAALLSACLGDVDLGDAHWDDDRKGIYDAHGEFHYSVVRCAEVPPEHLAIMKKYL
jgi:hypothetical protein